MSHRFRFIGTHQDEGTWIIKGEEHTHLAKVLRLSVGTEVEVMEEDSGLWCVGVIKDLTSGSALVTAIETRKETPGSTRLVIALGALGHGEIDEVIAPLVELGVDDIVIFGQDDQGKNRINDKAVERWHRMILNACKQCKRALRTKLTILKNCDDLLPYSTSWSVKLVGAADQGTGAINGPMASKGTVGVVVGSEKGLSAREAKLLETAGFAPFRLGNHVLRAKTAAIAVAAVLTDRLARPPSLMI